MGVWAKDESSSTSTLDLNTSILYTVTPASCQGPLTLTASPSSPQPSGTMVTFTAAVSNCSHSGPLYQFLIRPATSPTWTWVQAYSTSNVFNWTTGDKSGLYYVGVWARDVDSASSSSEDLATSIPYTLHATTCAAVTVSASPSTVPYNTLTGWAVNVSAVASGCTNTPLYQFWLRPASSSRWQLVMDYGPSATYTWSSTGAAPGIVYLGVHVRDSGSPAPYDAVASTPVTVTPATCPSVSISASPASVVHSSSNGTHVTVTASAPSCSNEPIYQFWIRPASSSTWQLVQAWSQSATYDWNSTGAAPGTVYIGVHVRDGYSSNQYDAVASTPVSVT